jgi:hypothetical protein
MIRKQFFIGKNENARLKSAALSTGRSEGDLIREGIKHVLERENASAEDWKAGLLSVAGMWADYPEIEQIMEMRRKKRRERRKRMNRLMRDG